MRLVVLVSGSGTNLHAMIDALHQGDVEVDIAAVGADLECAGLDRARAAGIDTFVVPLSEYEGEAAKAFVERYKQAHGKVPGSEAAYNYLAFHAMA